MSAAKCNADLGHPCDANDGEPCAACVSWELEMRRAYDRGPKHIECDANELREAGRGHLVRGC